MPGEELTRVRHYVLSNRVERVFVAFDEFIVQRLKLRAGGYSFDSADVALLLSLREGGPILSVAATGG